MDRRFPWPLIAAWLITGAVGNQAIGVALDGRSSAVSGALTVEAYILWGLIWVAMLVPRTTTLTVSRIGVPAAAVAAITTIVAGGTGGWTVAFLIASVATLAVLATPSVIDAFVDGSSYGPERRFALRTPFLTALVAVPMTWVVAAMILVVPGLTAARLWIPAAAVTVAWAIGVRWAVRSLQLPARRWVVFVPAGMVIADPLVLVDALLLPRRNIATLGPAFASTDAIDLTHGTLGLALQVDLSDPFEIPLRDFATSQERSLVTDRLVFAVLRPGAMLAEASQRRVSVGETTAQVPTCVHHTEESQTAVALPRTRSSR